MPGCKTNEPIDNKAKPAAFINPPVPGVNVDYENFSFDAEKGDTLYYHTGSVLIFPKNALVDAHGKPVSGKVRIAYREFLDPVDFYFAGIPMNYDSGGTVYNFESAAMCEIKGFQDSTAIFVNPAAKPELILSTANSSTEQNLYYLDTLQKRWINKGKDVVTVLSETKIISNKAKCDTIRGFTVPVPPLKPIKAVGNQPVFNIRIESGSLPELMPYNNFKFEVDESETTYDPSKADIVWNDVEIENTNKRGIYKVTFSNYSKTVSILARPVFEGKAWDEAMQIFEERQKEYQVLLSKRKLDEKKAKEEYDRQYAAQEERNKKIREENERIARVNAFIEERNRTTKIMWDDYRKRLNELDSSSRVRLLVKAINEDLPDTSEFSDSEKEVARQILQQQDLRNTITRTFTIDGFGFWNCDQINRLETRNILAKFRNEKNEVLDMSSFLTVFKKANSIVYCFNNQLPVSRVSDQLIWAVIDGKLLYITFEDFEKKYREVILNPGLTITLRTFEKPITTPREVRRVLQI